MKRLGMILVLLLLSQQLQAADSVVVVLDASGSMNEIIKTTDGKRVTRMEAAKTVMAKTLLNLPKGTHVGIVVFPYQDWVYKLGPVEPTRLRNAIEGISPDGGTPLGEYMKVGVDALLEARKVSPYGVYRLLIVTDGEANDSHIVTKNMDLILARGIIVNTIGVAMGENHQLATKSHSYANAANSQALLESVQIALSAEITTDDKTSDEMFDAISFLPDALVGTILTSLTRIQNQPLGEIMVPVINPDGTSALDENGDPIMESVSAPEESTRFSVWLILGFLCGGIAMIGAAQYLKHH